MSGFNKNQDFVASSINFKSERTLNSVRTTRKLEGISPSIARTRSPSSLLF